MMDDTVWTEIIRLVHQTPCDGITYDSLLLPVNGITVGYFALSEQKVWGKKSLDTDTYLLYDFALIEQESATVLFSLLNAYAFNPAFHLRDITVDTKSSLSLPEGEVTQLELTSESSPFPPYFVPGQASNERWIPTVGSTVNPFTAFECIAFGCENSFRLNRLYVGDGVLRYEVDRPNRVSSPTPNFLNAFIAAGQLHTENSSTSVLDVQLINWQGQQLRQYQIHPGSSMHALPAGLVRGIYLIRFSQNGQLFALKLFY